MKLIEEVRTNKSAYFNYIILKSYECGIVLLGTEVKSLKTKNINFCGAYAAFKNNELFLFDLAVEPYAYTTIQNCDINRTRKLLLHKNELKKIKQSIDEKGISLIPLKIFVKNNKIKISIGLARGKTYIDKRNIIKSRETNKEIFSVLKRGVR